MSTKKDIIAKTDVLVVGGTMAHRRGLAQMVYAGLQIMQGGDFNVQVNCPDSIKCHVTAGDGAEQALKGLEVVSLQLAAAAHPYLNSSDEVDGFAQLEPGDLSATDEFIRRNLFERQQVKRSVFDRDVELVMTHGQEIIARENLAEFLEDLNREELIAYITGLAAVVDKFVGPVKDPAAPRWTLRVSETNFDIKIPNAGISGRHSSFDVLELDTPPLTRNLSNYLTKERPNHQLDQLLIEPHFAEATLSAALAPDKGGFTQKVDADHGVDADGKEIE